MITFKEFLLVEKTDAVKTLEDSLCEPTGYDAIDQMMKTISKESGISPKELHDSFVKKHGKTPDDYAKTMTEEKKVPEPTGELKDACWKGYTAVGMKMKNGRKVPNCVPVKEELSADEQFDVIEEMVMSMAEEYNMDPELVWEKFESIDDDELFEAAVDAKGHKSSTGGLTQKGRDAYNAKGANLKPPVTTPPSKLKAGSKAANRRKSFCARMGGMEGPMKKPNGEPTRKALALRKWNC